MAAPLVPGDLWAAIEPLLPPVLVRPRGGRPRVLDRVALAGIIFVLRTGIQWRDVPAEIGCSGKTCWRRLVEWHAAGCSRPPGCNPARSRAPGQAARRPDKLHA